MECAIWIAIFTISCLMFKAGYTHRARIQRELSYITGTDDRNKATLINRDEP